MSLFEACANTEPAMRRAGYVRQAYSNYIQDQFASKAFAGESGPPEFLGWLDSDSFFTAAVTPHDLFDYDETRGRWRPRAILYNGCCMKWSESTRLALGGEQMGESDGQTRSVPEGGLPRVGEGMLGTAFPIIVRPRHLGMMRDHVRSALRAASFEEGLFQLCVDGPRAGRSGFISQFDGSRAVIKPETGHSLRAQYLTIRSPMAVIVNYLHLAHREEYSWAVRDHDKWGWPKYSRRSVALPDVLAEDDLDSPCPRMMVMKHKVDPLYVLQFSQLYRCIYPCLSEAERRATCRTADLRRLRISNFFEIWPKELMPQDKSKPDRKFPSQWADASRCHFTRVCRNPGAWPNLFDANASKA
eukprot:2321427-Prymnesium_polylepis.1